MERKPSNRLKIKLNDANNLRELLQEMYNEAVALSLQAQQEIAKLEAATDLSETGMDEKSKYAKAIHDYLAIKDKALGKKQDIAKQIAEINKANGNNSLANEDAQKKQTTFDFSKIREMLDNEMNTDNKTTVIELKKDIKNK